MNSAEPLEAHPAPGLLETTYGVLFRPRETFAGLPLERMLGTGALAILGVAAVSALATADEYGLYLAFVAEAGWLLLGWLLFGSALFVVSRAMHPRGELAGLFAALGLALLPWLFYAPLHVLGTAGSLGHTLACVAGAIWAVWCLRVLVAAVSGALGLGSARAAWAIGLAALVWLVLPVVVSLLGLAALFAVIT